jgi:ABC-type Fe3+-hydroxamate transport system substrate-binding protein
MIMRMTQWTAMAVISVALLGACGGGSSVDPLSQNAPNADVVAGVEVRTSVVVSEAQRLTASNTNDTAEPASLGSVTLATSETDEPADI